MINAKSPIAQPLSSGAIMSGPPTLRWRDIICGRCCHSWDAHHPQCPFRAIRIQAVAPAVPAAVPATVPPAVPPAEPAPADDDPLAPLDLAINMTTAAVELLAEAEEAFHDLPLTLVTERPHWMHKCRTLAILHRDRMRAALEEYRGIGLPNFGARD